MKRKVNHQHQSHIPPMGLPSDPAGVIDEVVQEIRNEVEARTRRGNKIGMPVGAERKAAIEERLGKKVE